MLCFHIVTLRLCYQEHHESLREAIENQQESDLREYLLGSDADGNTYLHFPQFCGADLRIYRQAPLPVPKLQRPIIKDEPVSHTNFWFLQLEIVRSL